MLKDGTRRPWAEYARLEVGLIRSPHVKFGRPTKRRHFSGQSVVAA